MTDRSKPMIIAIEEHYWDPVLVEHFSEAEGAKGGELKRRLEDLGEGRLREMDEAGIDLQVLSHAPPGTQKMDAALAVKLAREVNDRLCETVRAHPTRFAAFAALPTGAPEEAAEELERAVVKLGFKGALVHGLTNERFLDEKFFWPIFARAEALDVPVFLHPALPHPAIIEAYYKDYMKTHRGLATAGWGYGVEIGTLAIRMVLSGVFDVYPRLKFILGHLGEGIPYQLWRLNQAFSRNGQLKRPFQETFRENFHIVTSGFFSDPALQCAITEMGIDHVIFGVDWPFVENKPGVDWIRKAPLTADALDKICNGNARRLLRL